MLSPHSHSHTRHALDLTLCVAQRLLFGSSLGGRAGSIYAAAVGPAWMRYLDSLGPLRLLKLVRYYQDAVLLGSALRRSLSALMVPLSFMAILCLCFASVLFAIEVVEEDAASGSAVAAQALHNDSTAAQIIGSSSGLSAPAGRDAGRVTNVPDAIWLMLITMTTVGYGDFYPNTSLGRFLVSCAALCGIVIIAMPLAIIGANFNEAWNGRELQLVVSRLRLLLIEQGMSVNDVFTVFQAIDDDQNVGPGGGESSKPGLPSPAARLSSPVVTIVHWLSLGLARTRNHLLCPFTSPRLCAHQSTIQARMCGMWLRVTGHARLPRIPCRL